MKKKYITILLHLITIIALFSLAVISFYSVPEKNSIYPPCIFHTVTGYLCPICGSSRSLHSLAHGNFLSAMRSNIFLVATIVVGTALYIVKLFEIIFGKRVSFRIHYKAGYILIILLILFGLIRNIPYYPFTLLAP
jgi:hypothetical protein